MKTVVISSVIFLINIVAVLAQLNIEVYNNSKCGLNFEHHSIKVTDRTSELDMPGNPMPVTFSLRNIPEDCYEIEAAYIWWTVSYRFHSQGSPIVTVVNPENETIEYEALMTGQLESKCWGEEGTRGFRADITPCITGNGSYRISVDMDQWEVDGITMLVLYRDFRADYEGHLIIKDGLITKTASPSKSRLDGFRACDKSISGKAIMIVSDLQVSNTTGETQVQLNGTSVMFKNNFWNSEFVNTSVFKSQDDASFSIEAGADCYSWLMYGLYFQTNTCNECLDLLDIEVYQDQWSICPGESIILSADGASEYQWSSNPEGLNSNQRELVVYPKESTEYYLKGYSSENCKVGYDTVSVIVNQVPDAGITGDTGICKGDFTVLTAEPVGQTYLWNTGEDSRAISVTEAGLYEVIVENEFGCLDSAEVRVTFLDSIEVDITGITEFCEGDSSILSVEPYNQGYFILWSTGDSTKEITVKKAGEYHVIVANESGCFGYDTITVTVYPSPEADIEADGPLEFCEGGEVILKALPDGDYTYQWSTGEASREIIVTKAGFFKVIVENEKGCTDSSEVEVKVYPNPEVEVLTDDQLMLCRGDSIKLFTDKAFSQYLWSTNETSDSIYVHEPGPYLVMVTDSNGCKAKDTVLVEEKDIGIADLPDIEFGKICIDESGAQQAKIINNSEENVIVDRVRFKNSAGVFSLTPKTALPALIIPGDKITIDITFSPVNDEVYNNTVIVEFSEPCIVEKEFNLAGEGKIIVDAWIPEVHGEPGEVDVCIPILAKLNWNTGKELELDYNAIIRFNADAFLTDPGYDISVDNGKQQVSIQGTCTLSSGPTTIGEVCGTVLLAIEDSAEIEIVEINWDLPDICNSYLQGQLIQDSVCVNPIRKIIKLEKTEISVFPNPAGEEMEIEISTSETGRHRIEMVNVQGQSLKLNSWDNNSSEKTEYNFKFNTREIATGMYYIRLLSPSGMLVERVFVVK